VHESFLPVFHYFRQATHFVFGCDLLLLVRVFSGVEFATEANRPDKFLLEDYEEATEDELRQWNEKIDAVLASTKLLSPPNR